MFHLLYKKVNVDASPARSRVLSFMTNYIHFATFFVIYNHFVKLLIFFLTCKIKMGVRNREIYSTSTYYVCKNMNTECMHTFNAQTLRLFTTMLLFRICKKTSLKHDFLMKLHPLASILSSIQATHFLLLVVLFVKM